MTRLITTHYYPALLTPIVSASSGGLLRYPTELINSAGYFHSPINPGSFPHGTFPQIVTSETSDASPGSAGAAAAAGPFPYDPTYPAVYQVRGG